MTETVECVMPKIVFFFNYLRLTKTRTRISTEITWVDITHLWVESSNQVYLVFVSTYTTKQLKSDFWKIIRKELGKSWTKTKIKVKVKNE